MANEQHVNRRRFLGYGAAAAGGAILAGRGGLARAARPFSVPPSTPVGPGPGRYGGPAPVQIGGNLTFVCGDPEGPVHEARIKYIFDVLQEDYGVEDDHGRRHARLRTHRGPDPHQPDRLGRHRRRRLLRRPGRQGGLARADRLQHPRPVAVARGRGPGVLRARRRRRPSHRVEHHAGLRPRTKDRRRGSSSTTSRSSPDAAPCAAARCRRSPAPRSASGIAPADLYPLDLDAAFASLDGVRDSVVKWVDGGQPMQDLALAGEADLFNFYTSRCVTLKSDGEPIDFRFEQGTAEEADYVIIKGGPNTLQAQHAVALAMNTPEFHKVLAEATNIGFTNVLGMEMVDPAIRPLLTTAPENYAKLAPAGNDWWAENQPEAEQRFAEWILG